MFFVILGAYRELHVETVQLILSEFKQRVIDNYISEGLSYFENSPNCTLYK